MTRTHASTDRAVSPVIGAVLLAGILVLLLSIVQVNAVPNWNERVEFDHNERVQGDLQAFQSRIVAAAADGNRRTALVELGTSYPERYVLTSPAAPTGRLATRDPANVTIRNATASGEVGDYWDGGTRNFSTRAVVYGPDYRYYANAPETVYENGLLYNRFPSANRTLANPSLVDGNRITLVALDGNLSRVGADTATVAVKPVSAPPRTITVTNASGGRVVLSVPTTLDNETWAELLESEYAANGGKVVDQSYVSGTPYDRLVLTLEGGVNYELRMAKVGVGTDVEWTGPHYVTAVAGHDASIAVDDDHELTVEVRDRFNNPVSDVAVNASVVSGGGSVSPSSLRTDSDGRATFVYSSASPATATVEATIGPSPSALERATFAVEVTTASGNVGPETTDVTASPTTVEQGESFSLSANASDVGRGGLQVIAAEWFRNTTGDPGVGNANPLEPSDGAFDTVEEEVWNTSIGTDGWGLGDHEVAVRGRDANGRWGPVSGTIVTIVAQTTSDPEFASLAVDDRSNFFSAVFDVDYSIDDPDGRFQNVTVTFENLNDPSATETLSSASDSGTITYNGDFGTNGDSYRITMRIYDVDGDVVQTEVHTETADDSGQTVIV